MTDTWRYDAGLIDTMTDIIMDAVSAFAVAVLGFIKIKAGKWRKEKITGKEN